MIILIYGSENISNRIKLVLDSSDVEIIAIDEKITRPKDLKLLRKLKDIDLAIVDIEEIGAIQTCSYLGRVRKIALALLTDEVNTDWEKLISYPVIAYIPKDAEDQVLASDIRRILSRIRISSEVSRTEREVTLRTLQLATK